MKKTIITAAILTAAAITAGCGSGGMSGDSSMIGGSTAKSAISGSVADGYLVGAQVFLDKNYNYILDAGEPNTTTDATGAYQLAVDAADIGRYPVVAVAIAGVTTDLDNPTQKVASSYVLSMHAVSVAPAASGVAGSVNNFISPISTQVREMMETGKYADVNSAITELRTSLGMPSTTNIMGNYIANQNSQLHTIARNMASLMGSQAAQVVSAQGIGVANVNGYRSMMGTVFGNISTVRTNATAQTAAMTNLRNRMMTTVAAAPQVSQGVPFSNFSSFYRSRIGGGMMGRW